MITIPSNNLFKNGRIIQFSNGDQILVREKLELSQFSEFEYHRIKQNDELTAIAYKYYKGKVEDASKYWWVIADVNNIMKPYDISDLLGNDIVIPNILQARNIK